MATSTMGVGITPNGVVTRYVPPTVVQIEQGQGVTYGSPQTLEDTEELPPGTWQIVSGTLIADGEVVVRLVTIG